jgi:LacI family transcriptional regulator
VAKRNHNSQKRSVKKEPRPKVALLIETSRGYGRGMLRGIVRYARLHGPWSFYVRPSDFDHALPKMKVWGGSGIIARVHTLEMADAIVEAGIPAVLLGADHRVVAQRTELAGMSEVWTDSEGAARIAAAHLLERGFQRFAYIGIPESIWSQRRSEAFCSAIQDSGFETSVYEPPQSKKDLEWENEQVILAKWLKALPKPTGLMACNDDRGRDVLEACRLAGVSVPEEVAVIGVDNDELFCELSDPPLSSVALNAEHGGYRTAHLLDQLMKRKIHTPQRLIVEPTHVVARRSTDFKTYSGREIGTALGFIHRNRAHNISVIDVADATGVSRRNLELKFRRSVGKTIREEIQRNRLEHAKRMLRDTDLPISQVAHASGYNSTSYLTQVFRKEVGISPAKYRAQVRN